MPHVVVLGEPRVVEADPAVHARDRIIPRRTAAPAGGQVDPGLVRQQRVVEVEGRPGAPADRSYPTMEPGGPTAPGQAVEHARPARPCPDADPRRADPGG